MRIELRCGDVIDLLPLLAPRSVDVCVTSPPYAEQRKGLYPGIPEADYPQWCCDWVRASFKCMRPDASWFIVIREHIKDGQISDYVPRTRLALREIAYECEEMIWIKPTGPPMGSPYRPRRQWERILWFSRARNPRIDLRANGRQSNRIGGFQEPKPWQVGTQAKIHSGRSRQTDFCCIPIGCELSKHPAPFPVELARWLIRLGCPRVGGCVLDPFIGSGTTGVAAVRERRSFVGIDCVSKYVRLSRDRIEREF